MATTTTPDWEQIRALLPRFEAEARAEGITVLAALDRFLAGFTAAPAKTVEPGPVTEAPAPPAPVEAEEDDADVEARLQKWVRWILAGDPPDEPLGRG